MEQVLHNHSSVRKSNNTNAMCAISATALKKVIYHAVSYILATLIAHTCSRTAERRNRYQNMKKYYQSKINTRGRYIGTDHAYGKDRPK
jgi:hypothetical protein